MSPAAKPEPVLNDDDEDPALIFTRHRTTGKPAGRRRAGEKTTADTQTAEQPESGNPRVRAGSEGQPRYRQQLRMEARLWPEQVPALAALRRQVSQARTVRGERITDNTLLRIAVDLLLAHADQLQGNTEDELRRSVVPNTGSAGQPE